MNKMRPARDASREQAQFLRVLSREEAMARFRQALDPKPLGIEHVALAQALGRVVGDHIAAPVDVPPFDRSNVDGFALRAGDVARASDNSPVSLALNDETIACGTEPRLTVSAGTATPIATGGPIPRGADAVVMIEQTEIEDERLLVRAPRRPRRRTSRLPAATSRSARSCCAKARRSARARSPCSRRAASIAWRCLAKRVWGCSRPAMSYRAEQQAEVRGDLRFQRADCRREHWENGGEPVLYGIVSDNAEAIEGTLRKALAECDMVVLSGGTSKGAGDLPPTLWNARQARHCCAWRRAETRQAALSCGCRR